MRYRVTLVLATAISLARLLPAQAAANTILGTIRDSAGTPIPDAVIVLDPSGGSRVTRADDEGRFRFDKVKSGQHALRTTWLNYAPDDRTVDVPAAGLVVTIVLRALPYPLDTVPIVARRTGIFGMTVAASDLRALGGAEVEVLGVPRARARTASDGRFSFGNLRPGAYMVRASRAAFETRFLSVVVPHEGATELSVSLDTLTAKAAKLEEPLYMDMRMRVDRRNINNSAIVPGRELAISRAQTLDISLRYAPSFLLKGLQIMGNECVFINGQPAPGRRLRDVGADDVAMVEVYGSGTEDNNIVNQSELWKRFGHDECGVWATMQLVPVGDSTHTVYWKYVARPRQGQVTFVYVWLRK